MTNTLPNTDSYEQDAELHQETASSQSSNVHADFGTHHSGFHRRVVSVESSPAFDGLPESVEGSPFVAVDRDVHYTLGDAYDEMRTLSRHHHDRVVSLQDVTGVTVNQIRIGDQTHAISQVAARYLCARLDLPYKYLRSLPEHLQRVNFAHGLRQHRDAVAWALPFELTASNTLFNIVQTLTKAAHYAGLTTEQNTQLQQIGGEVLRRMGR